MLFHLVSTGWTLLAGLVSGLAATIIEGACLLYMPVYAYLALRNVFGQHRSGTLLRGCLLLASYVIVIIIGFVVTALTALLMT